MATLQSLSSMLAEVLQYFNVDKVGYLTGIKVNRKSIEDAYAPNTLVTGSGIKKITSSATPPVNPQVGDLWIDIN